MPTTRPKTKSGTPRLSEAARHLVAPSNITSTAWPAVRKVCTEKLGVGFDPWQEGAGRLMLAKRADGTLAAMVDGVGMSLPRQVGKTYLVGAMVFALCVDRPGLLVIWSAHHARTHSETFLSMQGFAGRSKVKGHVAQVFKGSGDEEIRFHNGSRVLFGARERGFGRGIPGVDVLIFDEAQILSDRALSNMLATMNTSRFGLQLYIGTPPKPDDMAEAFTRMRTEALAGHLHDGAWIELGADSDADPKDRKQWAKANPSYPLRTPEQSILRLQRKLTPADFLREGLGIWEDPDENAGIFGSEWDLNGVDEEPLGTTPVLALAATYEMSHACIGAAVMRDGDFWVKPLAHGPGVGWVIDEVASLQAQHRAAVILDRRGPAASLITPLEDAGVRLTLVDTAAVIEACALVTDAVTGKRFHHPRNPHLDAAVLGAKWRSVGDRRAFGRKHGVDITPLEAVTLAAHGAAQALNYDVSDSIG